jgi:hypothetical protein
VMNNACMRFESLSTIEQLISNEIPESTSLEYKSEVDLNGTKARRELLKDLTAMGNGGGGSVIFGVLEEPETSIARQITALKSVAIVGQIENIVRDSVYPPLVWSHIEFETDEGWVIVADVERSSLGPYMIEAYEDQRYYKRSGRSIGKMREREIRDLYSLSSRLAERRDEVWNRHFLPIPTLSNVPALKVSGVPNEPLVEIFHGGAIDLFEFINPSVLRTYQTHVPLSRVTLRHWADGLTSDDFVTDELLSLVLRFHRDGAAGIAQKIDPQLKTRDIARLLNAYLIYLAWFWSKYSLQQSIELEITVTGLQECVLLTLPGGLTKLRASQPPHVEVEHVSVKDEVRPWELLRASVRHNLIKRFIERLCLSFDFVHSGDQFSFGMLLGAQRQEIGLALFRGAILDPRQNIRTNQFDADGRLFGTSGKVVAFVRDGSIFDANGDTLAVVEMSTSFACPDDFLPNIDVVQRIDVWNGGIEPLDVTQTADIPLPTGRWSSQDLKQLIGAIS